jgi:hypothetical protein
MIVDVIVGASSHVDEFRAGKADLSRSPYAGQMLAQFLKAVIRVLSARLNFHKNRPAIPKYEIDLGSRNNSQSVPNRFRDGDLTFFSYAHQ